MQRTVMYSSAHRLRGGLSGRGSAVASGGFSGLARRRWIQAGSGFVVGVVVALMISAERGGAVPGLAGGQVLERGSELESEELARINQRLRLELAALRSQGSLVDNSFHDAVSTRLQELQSVIESTTAIKLSDRQPARRGMGGVSAERAASKSDSSKSTSVKGREASRPRTRESRSVGPLAAVLDSPVLKSRGARSGVEPSSAKRLKQGAQSGKQGESQRAVQHGVGGGEVECLATAEGGSVCGATVDTDDTLAQLSLEEGGAEPVVATTETQRQGRELAERVAYLTDQLRRLPIGVPVEGELSSGYGRRASPFSGRASFHEGLDLSIDSGVGVIATADGVVTKAGYDRTYGWMVDVRHGNQLSTRYAHLSRISVKVGQQVERGDRLGLSGSSGRSTGPHLHYEVRQRGLPRDPMPFLSLAERLAVL